MLKRWLAAAVLTALLAADLGRQAWNARPYIVTEHSAADGYLTVRYTLPGGGEGTWRRYVSAGAAECWAIAKIGQRIPHCMWSHAQQGQFP